MREETVGRPLAVALTFLLIPLGSFPVAATTRRVPAVYASIQEAISASSPGDTVLVSPGTYSEHVDFLGKDVSVRSVQGAETTIIDATGSSASVARLAGCGEGARLEGFTLRGGVGTTGNGHYFSGGGILIEDSRDQGPAIEDNWIIYNSAAQGAGALLTSSARLIRNRIAFNTAGYRGGGLWCQALTATFALVISDNEIVGNRVTGDGAFRDGGAIYSVAPAIISRNVIACNEAWEAGGIRVSSPLSGTAVVERNTIFANWGRQGVGGVYLSAAYDVSPLEFRGNAVVFNFGGGVECARYTNNFIAECNDVNGNDPDFMSDDCADAFAGDTNFRADPLFGQASGCPPAPGDLCLSQDSPLLPEHSPPGCGLIGALGLCGPIAVREVELPRPSMFWALDPRPNPFAVRTEIPFHLGEPSAVEVTIYGVMGRKVRTLRAGFLGAGDHELAWDARDDGGCRAAAGGYVAVIRAGGREATRTLLLVW